MKINYTNHAEKRCRQRGIPSEVISCILQYGATKHTYKNVKHFLKRKDLNFLRKENPLVFSKYEKQLKSTALVVCSETSSIITVMKITKAIRI